jgi:hypothetical protein
VLNTVHRRKKIKNLFNNLEIVANDRLVAFQHVRCSADGLGSEAVRGGGGEGVAVPVNAPLVEDDHDGEQEVMGEEGGLGQHLHHRVREGFRTGRISTFKWKETVRPD